MPLRLDDDVIERIADQIQVIRVTAADEAGEVRALPDIVGTADVEVQDGARFARAQVHVRVHQNAAQSPRNGYLLDAGIIDAHRERETAEQAGRNVVDVCRTAR